MLSPIRKLYGDAAKPIANLGFSELITAMIQMFNKNDEAVEEEAERGAEKADALRKEAEEEGRKQQAEAVAAGGKRKAAREVEIKLKVMIKF